MKKFISKTLVGSLLITMLLFSTAFASTNDHANLDKKVDGVNVDLSFMKDEVKTGSNDLMIELRDSNDKPIGDAEVKVIADMDRTDDSMSMDMSNTKPLKIELKNSHEVGQYMGTLDFTDSGEWMIKVNYTIDGKERVADFNINVVKGGPNWYIIGGFLGAIAIIIVLAAIGKKRKSARR